MPRPAVELKGGYKHSFFGELDQIVLGEVWGRDSIRRG
jgi:hypothetical protein